MADRDFSLLQDLLHELFEYRDGCLLWKKSIGNQVFAGNLLGTIRPDGYLQGTINRKIYRVHRLIYLYHYGYIPQCIDHIDGNRSNNLIENLRVANRSQNNFNQRISSKNTSGVKGVHWNKEKQKWMASCKTYKKSKHLGYYPSLEAAELAVKTYREIFHGEFANHG
jgi:HNH endonuclease/AP2 domain